MKTSIVKGLELITCASILFYAIILLTYTLERV